MKLLALDSSGLVASVAIVEDDNMLGEYTVNYKKTHSQTLLPMLDEVAKMIELDLNSIDAIAVAAGPGSFTGLRIGSATAKGLGLALDKPLIHIPTVDAIACNLWGHQSLICPLMDARRQQTYTGIYEFKNGALEILQQQCAVGINEIIAQINEINRPVTFLGDGVAVFHDYIEENCTVAARLCAGTYEQAACGSGSMAWTSVCKRRKIRDSSGALPGLSASVTGRT